MSGSLALADPQRQAPPAVRVASLVHCFQVLEKGEGLREGLRSFFRPKYRTVRAVDGISLTIAPGEIVGFLGPNGAGKTTTLKVLAGLLTPTSGVVSVLGHQPWRRAPAYLRRVSMVMGQKQQLWWDLPAIETLRLNQAIYEVPESEFRRSLGELTDLLAAGPLLTVPVRKLSLGERMKCELLAALIHRPALVLLDEPTIGLDIVMQRRVRDFIGDYNRRSGATVILTSHYLEDVRQLCERVVVIDRGKLVYDGALAQLGGEAAAARLITVQVDSPVARERFERFGDVLEFDPLKAVLRVPQAEVSGRAARLLAELPVVDLAVSEVPLEDVVHSIFAGDGSPVAAAVVDGEAAAARPPAGS